MTKKLTPSHIAVAVAAGLTAQTALAQTPPPKIPVNGSGQELTPMIKLDNDQYSGQGFFEKNAPGSKKAAPASAVKDPMLPLSIVGSKAAKENTTGSLTPPIATVTDPTSSGAKEQLKKPEELHAKETAKKDALEEKVQPENNVKTLTPTVIVQKKKSVVKKAKHAKKQVETPFHPMLKEAVPVEVKELPSAAEPVAPALYAATSDTPVVVTEVVRIDSISLAAPTYAEAETQPLPRLPEPEPMVAAIMPEPLPVHKEPVETFAVTTKDVSAVPVETLTPVPVEVVVAQAPSNYIPPSAPVIERPILSNSSQQGLSPLDAPSIEIIRGHSGMSTPPVQHPAPIPSVMASSPKQSNATRNKPSVKADSKDARIQELLDELSRLQATPMKVETVQAPIELVPANEVVVPKIDPAATIQLPLPPEPRRLIKPAPKEEPRMITEHAPQAPTDVPQTVAVDAPRTMVAPPVLAPRQHRVANPKFAGLPEKGDFIAFMPGSSHVSEETVESLRSMVSVFKEHGIRKIVLTGTALRDEDTEDMEASAFAQKRAKNLKAAFQRAGFKGVIALDDPKRAKPGTTPRVGLVALK